MFELLFIKDLMDLLRAEKQLVHALTKVIQGTTIDSMRSAFAEHLEQTVAHLEGVEQLVALVNKLPQAEHCETMEKPIDEATELLEDAEQRVGQYESSDCNAAGMLAELLGIDTVLSQRMLDEEEQSDENPTNLAGLRPSVYVVK
jgi:ferritin-like metal-binding protein YciE